jgi:polyhydroxyalkanoate synthesis regulator phasin
LSEVIDLGEEKRISWNDNVTNDIRTNNTGTNENIYNIGSNTNSIFSKLKVKPTELDALKSRVNFLERKIEMILEKINI